MRSISSVLLDTAIGAAHRDCPPSRPIIRRTTQNDSHCLNGNTRNAISLIVPKDREKHLRPEHFMP
jgi:hypothetical protein